MKLPNGYTLHLKVIDELPQGPHKYFRHCALDRDAKTVTVEVHSCVTSVRMNIPVLENYTTETDLKTVDGRLVIEAISSNENLVPTCACYVPSQSDIESGSVMVPNWPYNRGKMNAQCTNIRITKNEKYANCVQPSTQLDCSFYSTNEWAPLSSTLVNGAVRVELRQRFFGARKPKYEIVNDGEVQSTPETREEAENDFTAASDKLSESGETINVTSPEQTRTSFFGKVLSV